MPHSITKWSCNFCKREYKVEVNALRHEDRCYHDPANMACITCKHYDADLQEVHRLAGGWDIDDMRFERVCLIEASDTVPTHHCGQHEIAEKKT